VYGLDAETIGQLALDNRVLLSEVTQERSDLQQVFLELTEETPVAAEGVK
jgi:ABC-2 type transport system ATP-binding protein